MQIAAFDLRPADLINSNDIRMVERGGGASLPLEPAQTVAIRCEFGRQQLQRDAAFEPCVLRQKNLAHSAFAELRENPVMADNTPDERAAMFLDQRIGAGVEGGRVEE